MASGSIRNVYRAKLKGRDVAVKVRHGNLEENIRLDLAILFGCVRLLGRLHSLFDIPVNQNELERVLQDQLFFRIEKENIATFRRVFSHPDIRFPRVEESSTESVLIEDWLQGKPMHRFESQSNPAVNRAIAKLGASCFFEMLIKHNFVHADCHGGNIMVEVDPADKGWLDSLRQGWEDWAERARFLGYRWVAGGGWKDAMFKEEQQSCQAVRQALREAGLRVSITVLDAGMVVQLSPEKHRFFINFLRGLIEDSPAQCARNVLQMSAGQGREGREQYLRALEEMFGRVRSRDLREIEGVRVLQGMLEVIRQHSMALDGDYGALLTNMLVLEGLAKQLDPEVNILRCALPFFIYAP